MKKLIVTSIILSAILLAGCENDMLEIADAKESAFVASIEKFENDTQTKTSLSAQNVVVWNAGDQIAIFQGAPVVSKFEVEQACEGTSDGMFNPVQESASQGSGFTSVMEIAANVAVYPYAQELTLSESANDAQEHTYIISNVTIPAQQEYLENSFPKGTFAMVAVTESVSDKMLKFRNVLGAIKLQLLGDCKVKTIEIEGNKGEMLSGRANISAYKDSYVPVITMLDEEATKVTLNCGEGVQLNPDNATNFIIALPPTNFDEGFTVTVTDAAGNEKEIKTTVSNTVQRSYILKMPKLNINHLNAGEELDYILFEDEIVEELCIHAFDTNNDGKLQFAEAAAVTDIRVMSLQGRNINSFNELKYFTSLKIIPDEYFMNTGIKSVVIPEGVEVIGYRAFSGVDINNIVLPESLKSIGERSFSSCGKLESIVLPASLKDIDQYAFSGCTSLQSIILPESIEYLEEGTFSACASLKSITLPSLLKAINQYVFEGCKSLTSIDLPESIRDIGAGAFAGCSSLKSIELPDNLKNFGFLSVGSYGPYPRDGVFYECTALEKIELPSKITSIPDYTFEGCMSLKEITVSSVITAIGDYAFAGCSLLKKVDFLSGVTELGQGAFKDCALLNGITLNPSITAVGEETFSGCYSLEFNLNSAIQSVGELAFYGCKTIKLLENVPVFEYNTFTDVSNLYINYADLSKFKDNDCVSLYVKVPDEILTIADVTFEFFDASNIIIEGKIETIGKRVFYNCDAASITLPSTVITIGEEAFRGCHSLQSVTIPANVEIIGDNAFKYCSSLISCTIKSPSLAEYATDVFYGCYNLANIFVPSTSIDAYKAGWPDYASLIKAIQ